MGVVGSGEGAGALGRGAGSERARSGPMSSIALGPGAGARGEGAGTARGSHRLVLLRVRTFSTLAQLAGQRKVSARTGPSSTSLESRLTYQAHALTLGTFKSPQFINVARLSLAISLKCWLFSTARRRG